MKHLKSYENINSDLKKYFIIKSMIGFIVLEVIRIYYDDDNVERLDLKQKYIYLSNDHFKTLDEEQLKKVFHFTAKYMRKRIIFQSDSLKECVDVLPILTIQNKYNL